MYSKYLSDSVVASALSDQAFIQQFLTFEIMLAEVQGDMGIIPVDAAKEIGEVLSKIQIKPEALADTFLANGIPTLGILAQCRKQLSAASKNYLHYGTTSQDAIDTAHILMYKEALAIIREKQDRLIRSSVDAADQSRTIYAVARTRSQQAGPISYGVRIALWMDPLLELRTDFDQISGKTLKLQLAGAFGTNAALGKEGQKVAIAVAKKLGLAYQGNWQSNRLGIKKLSDWLCSLTGCLGKIARDMLFLSSTEVGEWKEHKQGGGGSSSMPHKSNPVLSEAIVAMATENNTEALKVNQAMIHMTERDASAWILEWKAMKTLLINTTTCLNHMITIMENFELNQENINRNLDLTNGLIYSAMAKAKLKEYLPDADPQQIIDQAMDQVKNEESSLANALNELASIEENWEAILQPENYLGQSDEIIDTFMAKAHR